MIGGKRMVCLTIDLGESYLKTAIYTQITKQLIEKEQFDSPDTWDKMKRLLDACIKTYIESYDISAISFSLPGTIHQETGKIEGLQSLEYLEEIDFRETFTSTYELPVFVESRVRCAGAAEISLGMKDEHVNALVLLVDEGISGAIYYEGNNYTGMHQRAGDFGKILLDGKRDLNELCSPVAMAKRYSKDRNQEFTAKEIFQRAEDGETEAISFYEELFYYIALAIYNFQYSFDPEWIILSGEITQEEKIFEPINRKLMEIVNENKKGAIIPQIRLAHFQSDASLIGAGVLATK
ncbi:hypothetical protein RV11_GL000448 [Enterococcus phoeniculicola]|nr:hypothetical protein RV11_GL000448 [Enterococcus phoeniculicola]